MQDRKSRLNQIAQHKALALLSVGVHAERLKVGQENKVHLIHWINKMPVDLKGWLSDAIELVLSWSSTELDSAMDTVKINSNHLTDFVAQHIVTEEQLDVLKKRGAVFTPYWLATCVARNTLGYWRRLHRSGKQPSSLADLSCGCGAFLLACQTRKFLKHFLTWNVRIFKRRSDTPLRLYENENSH